MTDPTETPRERFQRLHAGRLAEAAVREADSGGRAFDEDEHPYRTCFQRDRDRIMHCAAFRRLDFKTQVFVPHEHDHFRTRLTHTLEVAQIGRDLGRALRLNEDLIEAVALAHDLGHPPFGHAGENALDELMSEAGGFEHNRQSLRIVDYLEHPYPGFRGLNLTRVVRECLARHETKYDTPSCEEFPTDLAAPLEGQLVDLADEIAYTSADLEDALASTLVSAEQLKGVSLWERATASARAQYDGARPIHIRIRACKAVVAILADDLLAATRGNIDDLRIDSPKAARRAGRKCVALSEPIRGELDRMQAFLLENVYRHPECVRRQEESVGVIRELFGALASRPELLPERYFRRVEADGPSRVVCDYVAGMTDRFCRAEHARLFR